MQFRLRDGWARGDTETTYTRVLSLSDREVDVLLSRRKRKTLALVVESDSSVEIRAPLKYSWREINAFLDSRTDWIEKAIQQVESRPRPEQPSFLAGSRIRYLGEHLTLRPQTGARRWVRRQGDELIVMARGEMTAARVEDLVNDWYRDEAEGFLPGRVEACRQRFPFELPVTGLRFRRMKARWGSCSAKGEICLNTLLMRQPLDAIDLVVTHELCHLRHFGHDAGFYRCLGDAMPDWQERERLLLP